MDLGALALMYRRELLDNVIPFWLRHSVDREQGGFFSCLDRDGSVFDDRKYVWMMGRQVWMLAKLFNEVERRAEWLEAASHGLRFLEEHACDAEGRVWFSLARDGRPAFFQRKPYAAVFLALALHEYGRATADESRKKRAKELFAKVRHWVASPGELGRPVLGPPMSQLADIYVTAFLAEELGEPRWIPGCLDQVQKHLDPARGTLLENAGAGDTPEGRLFCPGSVFEIGWILLRQTRDAQAREMLLSAMAAAHEQGWDQQHGGYYYFLDIGGRPPLMLEWNMKLWWVHVEALVAFVHAYEATGDPAWLRRFQQAHDYTWSHFPDAAQGEWFAYLDRRGEPTHYLKGGPYKCCFHVPRALWMVSRVLDRLVTSGR
jgi:N-acylglucosamine 2-epimerase